MSDYKRLRDLRCELHVAELAVWKFLQTEWPIGAPIVWRKGSGEKCGTVVMHSGSDRIKVRNDVTEREYWIDAYDMVRSADG